MFNYTSINWVKNVKHNFGEGWAYREYEEGSSFFLNFSKRWGESNAGLANVGEVIALFQTINKGYEVAKGTYFTHLVTPLDSEVRVVESTHPLARFVGVLAKPAIPIPVVSLKFNMYKPGWGACCDIDLVEHKKGGTSFLRIQKQEIIWNAFSVSNQEMLDFFSVPPPVPEDEDSALEGTLRTKLREHKYHERNPGIVRRAKEAAIREKKLRCEVCTFDFALRFPVLGNGFMECHHKIPINQGIERETRIQDLALVCANCHRMLHRRHEGRFLSIKELQNLRTQ